MILFIKKYENGKDGKSKSFIINTGRKIAWDLKDENVTVDNVLQIARAINTREDCKRISLDFSMLESFLGIIPTTYIRRLEVKNFYKVFTLDLVASRAICHADTVTGLFIPDNETIVLRLEQLVDLL
ncbi:MAG: hypothetical protein IJE43_19720 [Alphaproteobacteria bacterium]|nr:hypothetical protein [Alphaproteobacteria bacterium]